MSKYSKEQLRAVFQRPFNEDTWKTLLIDIFRANNVRVKPEKFTDPGQSETGWYMGNIETPDNYRIGLFFYRINSGSVAHKKVGLRNLVKSWVNPNWGEFDAAIVVFSDGTDWRLSFVCDIKDVATCPKRFTFVFGEKDNFYRTPIERFTTLQNEEPTFKNIHKAFSVEALSDDFFDQYREYYADFVEFITGKRYVKEGTKWVERVIHNPNYQYSDTFGCDDKLVRDYIKKMFGRIVFLYFLQRKEWLDGNRNYMHDLFVNSDKKDDFLDGVLEPLFFEILNTDKPYRTAAAKALPGSDNIPYLNGGLFAADEIDELDCKFPESLFSKFFNFLDSYNFTIDENDADDAEIGIDPEMLGRIFENLLEDNKDKGAFYTPKEIVDYMCRESIIAYLQNDRFTDSGNETIRKFVETYDGASLSVEQRKYLKDKLKSVKICDPAIGSGAFPMGLVNLLSKLYSALHLSTDAAVIKRHIMEQNIYGVDIEKGAVDIARLRFWLAMIVEEKDPIPLPNLHFKIMQGNSLLESYQGVDLSDLTKVKPITRNLFDSEDTERETLVADLKKYYETSDHAERDRLFNDIIKNVRRQLFAKNITLPQGMDPSANEDFFLWHTWFSDVFEKGGFDIVIGNPPYIEFKNYPKSEKDKLKHYVTAKGKYDIYIPFIERGINLLRSKGFLNYICPTRFLKRDYGKALREFISNNLRLNTLVDFSDVQVFENAMTYTGIVMLQNLSEENSYCFRYASGLDKKYDLVASSKLKNEIWDFSNGMKASLIAKIQKQGETLDSISNGIIQGIATGKDSVFLVKEDVISQYSIEKDIIRPFLKGKDISPYKINWSGFYVIYPYNPEGKVISEHEFKDKYPNAYHYLEMHRDDLKGRGYFDKSTKLWFELWNQRKAERFEGVKIVTLDNASRNSFSVDISNFYGTTTVYNIKLKDNSISPYYIVGILNSKLLDFYHKSKSIPQANGFYRYQAIFIKELPIVIANEQVQKKVERLVKNIMSGGSQTERDILNQNIDIIAYRIYGLKYEDILIVDPENTITREEYESYE